MVLYLVMIFRIIILVRRVITQNLCCIITSDTQQVREYRYVLCLEIRIFLCFIYVLLLPCNITTGAQEAQIFFYHSLQ